MVFYWTRTLYRGQIRFSAPMLYALGFVGLFTLGGLTGLFLASLPLDVHLTDTCFVTAHFHYIMVGGSVSAFFAGLHFWTDMLPGSINTAVLLTSSLTMAIAERATREGLVGLARAMLWAAIALGLCFLVVKGFEYRSDIDKHLLPGSEFPIVMTGAAQFWAFYWTVTVVHACHLTIGLGIVARLLAIPRASLARRWTTAKGSALYWHLVDILRVFLYPLIYLVGQ